MTTTLVNHRCRCHGPLEVIDVSGYSTTARCRACCYCSLLIEHPRIVTRIHLDAFHLKRGNGQFQRPLDDLSMATELVRRLKQALPLTLVANYDFGAATEAHVSALALAVDAGVTAYDLDRVLGDGPAITQLVLTALNQPDSSLTFVTAYDGGNWWDEEF